MTNVKFKNHYNQMKKKEEFYTIPDQTELTDQSELASASIVEMAKKFGIDAIIAKAEQSQVDDNIKDKLYGFDLSNGLKTTEERLNIRNKINNLFENIPARIRKEYFNDNVENLIDSYINKNEEKLTQLNYLGIVSDTQLNSVKEYNKKIKEIESENKKRNEFTEKMNEMYGDMYEKFKKTGNIIINNNENNTDNNRNV